MDNFSFVFSLFGLLMGLALAEAIGGFGKAIELRHKIRIGWLSPLLGLLICFDLISFWMVSWQDRAVIPVNFLTLAGGLLVFGLYYLIAQLAFPEDLEKWPDLDVYYLRHKKWLIGGMYLLNMLAMAGQWMIGLHPMSSFNDVATWAAFTAGAIGLFFLPGKKTNTVLLIYQLALYPVFDVLGMMGVAQSPS